MADFLLELRSEEIPARMQAGARKELEKLFRREMDAAGVAVGDLNVWSTPRRLALIARGLPTETAAVSDEAKGPPVGAPDQAVDGFCRKNGVTRDQLEVREVKGRETYFAVIEKPGQAVSDLLGAAITAIISDFSWPKSMRWGDASIHTESLKWVRPLSGIVALLDGEVVPCLTHGIASGRSTMGHRFHSNGAIEIEGADDYAAKLRDAHVIVDHEEREGIVRDGARKAASDAGLSVVEDEGLVIENAGLTEWPVPLLGRFDESFLDVPPEVIQLTARVNQKYFVCESAANDTGAGGENTLANAFICTSNIASANPAVVVDGNRKVLAARLADARFFWELDQKKTLAEHAESLERITFHEKLGTVWMKAARVGMLAKSLAQSNFAEHLSEEDAKKAGELSKSDLTTEMVQEFPELQGLMGGYYAKIQGLGDDISIAISEHYRPSGPSDVLPSTVLGQIVSLADKIDTLTSFFFIGMKPTGSSDPFALRRAAIGAIRLILEKGLRLPLRQLVGGHMSYTAGYLAALEVHKTVTEMLDSRRAAGFEVTEDDEKDAFAVAERRAKENRQPEEMENRIKPASNDLLDFFADRLKVQQREAGVRHDLIDAVFALGGEDDLVRLLARVKALQSFIETENGTNLLAGYKRAANILKKEEWLAAENVDGNSLSYTPETAEKALIDALADAAPKAATAVSEERFEDAMSALATLRAPIDAFFEDVTVNDDDPAKREARLNLLSRFTRAVGNVADFSKIEG